MKRLVLYLMSLFVLVLTSLTCQGQWIQTNGPFGGNVRALATIDDYIFAGTIAGVYVSSNHGTTWRIADTSLKYVRVTSMIAHEGKLYVSSLDQGVLLSTDLGESWTALDTSMTSTFFPIAAKGKTLFAGSYASMYRTTDDGATWTHTSIDEDDPSEISVICVSGADVYACTLDGNVYRSSDDGASWVKFALDLAPIPAMHSTSVGVIVSSQGGVHFSSDRGVTWSRVTGLDTNTFFIAIATHGSNVYALSGGNVIDNLFKSMDGGQSWNRLETDLPPDLKASIAFIGNQTFVTSSSGVHRSADEVSWTEVNEGMPITYVYAFASNASFLFAGTNESGVFRSSDGGASWLTADAGLPSSQIFSLAHAGSELFAATRRGFYRSLDDGATWARDEVGMVDSAGSSIQIMEIATSDGRIYAGGRRGAFGGSLFTRTIGETQWMPLLPDSEKVPVTALAADGPRLFAGLGSSGHVIHSTDYGINWKSSVNAIPKGVVHCIAMNSTHVFIATDSGVYVSTDNGVLWNLSYKRNGSTSIASILVRGPIIVASTSAYGGFPPYGVVVSTDNGLHWTDYDKGLDMRRTNILYAVDSLLFAGTSSAGAWRRPMDEIVSSVHSPTQPPSTLAMQAYSNAPRAGATISFSLLQPRYSTLNIFNMQGQCVATLLSQHLEAGPHCVEWNAVGGCAYGAGGASDGAKSISAGLYLVRLTTGDAVQTVPLLVVP